MVRSRPLPLCPHAAVPIERRLLGAQSDACARIGTGYAGSSSLTSTETYERLTKEEESAKAAKAAQQEREDRERFDEWAAEQDAKSTLLDRKKLDENLGYTKRYDETREDFRSKEKRKRQNGQQNRDVNWVEEEKRALRHTGTNHES